LKDIRKTSLTGFYLIGIGATFVGIIVIMIMNLATPVEFTIQHIKSLQQHGDVFFVKMAAQRFSVLCVVAVLSSLPFILILRKILKPVSGYFEQVKSGIQPSNEIKLKAKQSLINLPFIMVPVNIVFWIIIPSIVFTVAVLVGMIDSLTAVIFSIRSMMVGMISSAIIFFAMESFARHRIIPHLFPNGLLVNVENTAKLSISKRIRAFYRLGSLIPLVNIVLTLLILYWQVDSSAITAKEYGKGVLIFSIVVFVLFFVGSGFLNRLISRSISDPLNQMLFTMKEIKNGNYDARVEVICNDEIGALGDATNDMILGLKEKELITEAFGKYVTPEVRDEIISGRIPLDGEIKQVSILFSDLRDFTRMTETHDPKLVVKILNQYFEKMSQAISGQSGLILQFIGDEIYAVFGAPVSCHDHHERALAAALDMKERLALLNGSFKQKGWPLLKHGIGIHSGEAVAANIGSQDRASYLLVGDNINLASRLQSLTKELGAQIIISSVTYDHLQTESIKAIFQKYAEPVSIRGRSRKVDIYLNM